MSRARTRRRCRGILTVDASQSYRQASNSETKWHDGQREAGTDKNGRRYHDMARKRPSAQTHTRAAHHHHTPRDHRSRAGVPWSLGSTEMQTLGRADSRHIRCAAPPSYLWKARRGTGHQLEQVRYIAALSFGLAALLLLSTCFFKTLLYRARTMIYRNAGCGLWGRVARGRLGRVYQGPVVVFHLPSLRRRQSGVAGMEHLDHARGPVNGRRSIQNRQGSPPPLCPTDEAI